MGIAAEHYSSSLGEKSLAYKVYLPEFNTMTYASVTIHFTHLDADFSHIFTWLGRKGTDCCIFKAPGVKQRARIKDKDTYQIEKCNKLDNLLPYFLSIINQIHFHF